MSFGKGFGKGFDPTKFRSNLPSGDNARRQAGAFLGNIIAGHNTFIGDRPNQYSAGHAKHFLSVECSAASPTLALLMTEYMSCFLLKPERAMILPTLHRELEHRSAAICFWVKQSGNLDPRGAIPLRAFALLSQLVSFPFWLAISAVSPAVVHCALANANRITAMKYSSLQTGPSSFREFGIFAKESEEYEHYHNLHIATNTDFIAALLILLIVYFCCLR